jgi:small conductance mechanosensitive channel
MKELLKGAWNAVKDFVNGYGKVLIMALVVFVIGLLVIRLIKKSVKKTSTKSRNVDNAAASFITSIVALVAYVVLLIVMIASLGFSTEGIIAALSSVMLAIALGLQGTLASLANGILLIFTKPFQAGDYVDIGGAAGTVKEIKLFSVKIVTPDNITVIVPNSTVLSSVIINYSRLPIRRLDLVVPVSYGVDIAKVKQVVLDIVNADARVQKNPEPFFRLTEYGASSLNFTLRVWTLTGEFWNVKFDVMEKIVEAFRANGLEIPFNQLDVHVMPTEVH